MNETVSQMQERLFKILCDVDDYCSENNIRYYLSGGTCLGAIRHQGFIPWDDDADIMLPRPDYERFMKGFGKKYASKYGVANLTLDKNWVIPFGRIWDLSTKVEYKYVDINGMGVFMDVFPIDGLSKYPWKQKIMYKKIKILTVLRHAAIRLQFKEEEKYRTIKKLMQLVCKPIGGHRFAKAIEHQARRYPFDESKYVAVSMAVHYGSRETIRREHMSEGVRVMFNGRMLPVPKGYKRYLTNLYGDYMQIPKEVAEQGYTHLTRWNIEFNGETDENES